MVPPRGEECMVGENGCPYRPQCALYDDVISTHLFKFFLANQKAQFTNSTNQSRSLIYWVFLLEKVWEQKCQHFTDFTMDNIEYHSYQFDFRITTSIR